MWVDGQGVCHTVALPDPTMLMSEAFRCSLDRLIAEAPEAVADAVEAEEDRFFEEQAPLAGNQAAENHQLVGALPPAQLMGPPVTSVGDLRLLVRRIDRRWRLDVLVALDDYVS